MITIPFFLDKNALICHEFNYAKKRPNLPLNSVITLGSIAWHTGVLISLNTPNLTPFQLISNNGISIVFSPSSYSKNRIIFSSYNHQNNNILLYEHDIKKYFIPSVPQQFNTYCNLEKAIDLLILHEYFHFLQCNNFHSLNICPINCLNEIAAFSFAQKMENLIL